MRDEAVGPGTGRLVSSLYRLAPSQAVPDPKVAQKRLELAIHRLIKEFGGAEVRRRIREFEGPDDIKARLVLLALAAPEDDVKRKGL